MALTDTLHIETVSADKRHVEATMPIVPEVFQPHGYLHGGATIALLETAASIGTEHANPASACRQRRRYTSHNSGMRVRIGQRAKRPLP